MSVYSFEQTLRSLLRRQPFLPFYFVMNDGQMILADMREAVSFDGGSAGCMTPDQIHFIRCDDVRELRTIVPEPVA